MIGSWIAKSFALKFSFILIFVISRIATQMYAKFDLKIFLIFISAVFKYY
jgi:general stress protein CsbA